MEEKKRAPWMPIDAAWWPTIAGEMPLPWTRAAVLMDLRWWADQEKMGRVKRPGRRGLMSRWGWTERQARGALKSEEEWGNPTAAAPPVPQQNPTRAPDSARKPLESQEPLPHPCPSKTPLVSPRADIQNNTTTKPQTPECSKEHLSGAEPDDPLFATWQKVMALLKDKPVPMPRKLGKGKRRTHFKSRLRENGEEDVLRVMDWWVHSSHERATFLRETGKTIDTILQQSKFDMYLEMAHGDANKVHRPTQKQKRDGGFTSIRDLIREAEREQLNVVDFTTTSTTE